MSEITTDRQDLYIKARSVISRLLRDNLVEMVNGDEEECTILECGEIAVKIPYGDEFSVELYQKLQLEGLDPHIFVGTVSQYKISLNRYYFSPNNDLKDTGLTTFGEDVEMLEILNKPT